MLKEYVHPFNLLTLIVGIAILVFGSITTRYIDWTISVSILIATATYICAPLSLRLLFTRWFLVSIFLCWFCIDGIYSAYFFFIERNVSLVREANFWASLPLYWMMGLIWSLPKYPLLDALKTSKNLIHRCRRCTLPVK